MPKILIDILPVKSHFHATIKIASKLKKVGYYVEYCSQHLLQKDVEKYGFNFRFIPAIPITNVKFSRGIARVSQFFRYFFESLNGTKLQNVKKQLEEFEKTIKKISPDMVLLDEMSGLKAFFYEQLDLPVIIFQTKPDNRRIKDFPPFTSNFIPGKNLLSKFYCEILWKWLVLKYNVNKQFVRFVTFKQDNFSILKKILQENGIDIEQRIDLEHCFSIGLKGIPKLILSPKDFDFPHTEKVGVYRVGPLVDVHREGNIIMPRYRSLLNRLKQENGEKGNFVVYCSMGTITAKFKKKVKRFFLKMAKVAKLNPDYLFVISTGKDFEISQLLPSPDNLFIFEYVPQVDLLQYCNVMITHGGGNSITECIFCEVPTLNYPLSPSWDQPGCAARAVYHKVGLRGKINRDSPKIISRKLKTIKSNYSFYKKNVLAMKRKFEQKNNSDEVVEIIENILNKITYK